MSSILLATLLQADVSELLALWPMLVNRWRGIMLEAWTLDWGAAAQHLPALAAEASRFKELAEVRGHIDAGPVLHCAEPAVAADCWMMCYPLRAAGCFRFTVSVLYSCQHGFWFPI